MRGTMHKLPDAVEAAPDIYRILLENERTRVFNILLKPGDKVEMHSHPDHAVYVLSGQFVRFTSEDGKIKEACRQGRPSSSLQARTWPRTSGIRMPGTSSLN